MNIKHFLFLTILALGLSSCDNEVDITAEWKDVTVIYGLLDPEADTNFILIQRGYLGDEAAALSFNEPDSFYYNSLDVKLNWYNVTTEQLAGTEDLIVDFTSRQLNDNGPFGIQDAHRLYRVPSNVTISENFEYEIVVTKPNGEVTSARTNVMERISIFNPTPAGSPPKYRGSVRFENADLIEFTQIYFTFFYQELNLITEEKTPKSIEIEYGEVLKRGSSTYEIDVATTTFFDMIAARIEDDGNQDIVRVFDSLKLSIYGADETLYTYMNLNAPITGINQNRPDFTNVNNGIGIFASRSITTLGGIDLNDVGSPKSLKDELLFNQNMCPLRFLQIRGVDTCRCNDPVLLSLICN